MFLSSFGCFVGTCLNMFLIVFLGETLKGIRSVSVDMFVSLQDVVASDTIYTILRIGFDSSVLFVFIVCSLICLIHILSFLMFGFYYAATSGVINLPPSKRLYSYVFRHDNRYYKSCDVKRLVKVYNYPKDIGVRVESFGVRIAFGGKGGSNNIPSLDASLARTMAGLAMLMQVLLTHPRPPAPLSPTIFPRHLFTLLDPCLPLLLHCLPSYPCPQPPPPPPAPIQKVIDVGNGGRTRCWDQKDLNDFIMTSW